MAYLPALVLALYTFLGPALLAGLSPAGVELVGLGLLVLAPFWVWGCWRNSSAFLDGSAAIAALLTAVSAVALISWLLGVSPRPVWPFDHHNLLAAWVVALLPLSALGLREPGPRRVLAGAALALGALAVVASRSLGGSLALVAEVAAVVWLVRPRRERWLFGLATAGVLIFQLPRLVSLLAGADSSLAARRTYWAAGWEGFLARPWLGWGPGSVSLTVSRFLEPIPGVNPPGEIIGQLHSLPLQIAYELGLAGIAAGLALVTLLLVWGWRHRQSVQKAPLALAGWVGLLGAAVTVLTDVWLGTSAVPLAVAVTAGAALSARWASSAPMRSRVGAWLGLMLLLAGPAMARLGKAAQAEAAYDQARQAQTFEQSCPHLERAHDLDPRMPLYAARLAWCRGGDAALAHRAAEDALDIGVLWTSAGVLALLDTAAAPGQSEEALRRGLALDPLTAAAPYFLMAGRPDAADAAQCGARALLAEPRLAASTFFEQRPDLIGPIRRAIRTWPGIDAGWRKTVMDALPVPLSPGGEIGSLGLGFDDAQGGLSRYAFGRGAWPTAWFSIPVRTNRLVLFDMPPAAVLPTSQPAAFPKNACAP